MRPHTSSVPSRIKLGGHAVRLNDVDGFLADGKTVVFKNGMKVVVSPSEGESLRKAMAEKLKARTI